VFPRRLYFCQAIEDPDEEPFKSKYAASALLEELEAQLTPLLTKITTTTTAAMEATKLGDDGGEEGANASASADDRDASREALLDVRALITHRRGAIAVDTEEWARGEALLMTALEGLCRPTASSHWSSAECRAALLDTNNLLGVLWTNRSEPDRALPFLRDAQAVYNAHDSSGGGGGGAGGGGGRGAEEGGGGGARTAREEAGYTQTLFYLAQVLGQI
jgi:hypothetical protein